MVDIRRQETIVIESDKEYVARTFDEALKELTKVQAAIRCTSFKNEGTTDKRCESCKMFDANNVRRMMLDGSEGERCSIRLALNHIAAVRNIAKTGKP